jgi:hypothetical protein
MQADFVFIIIISGMLWNKHTRCSILEYQLVNTKFSLAHGYSWCKYLLELLTMGLDVYSTAVRVHVVPLACLKIVSRVLDYSIDSKYTTAGV